MSLTWAPGRQQTSLWDGSGQHIGPSVPLRRELAMTITLLFFLTKAVIIHRADRLFLGSPLDGASATS